MGPSPVRSVQRPPPTAAPPWRAGCAPVCCNRSWVKRTQFEDSRGMLTNSEESPLAGDTLQAMNAAILKGKAGTHDQILNRTGDQDLTSTRVFDATVPRERPRARCQRGRRQSSRAMARALEVVDGSEELVRASLPRV